jgi:hypothetical protein
VENAVGTVVPKIHKECGIETTKIQISTFAYFARAATHFDTPSIQIYSESWLENVTIAELSMPIVMHACANKSSYPI